MSQIWDMPRLIVQSDGILDKKLLKSLCDNRSNSHKKEAYSFVMALRGEWQDKIVHPRVLRKMMRGMPRDKRGISLAMLEH
ncbi:hypothetical protein TNCV_3886271 [Trichonephila clavipes]|nr:hypothetical protein TNCV_3886271 [Trichonephila clavipes]